MPYLNIFDGKTLFSESHRLHGLSIYLGNWRDSFITMCFSNKSLKRNSGSICKEIVLFSRFFAYLFGGCVKSSLTKLITSWPNFKDNVKSQEVLHQYLFHVLDLRIEQLTQRNTAPMQRQIKIDCTGLDGILQNYWTEILSRTSVHVEL